MAFPIQRLRRTRSTANLRGLVRETELSPTDFIYPIFVTAGEDVRNPVASMPGVFQLSINHAVEEAKKAHALGIPGVLLFGNFWGCGACVGERTRATDTVGSWKRRGASAGTPPASSASLTPPLLRLR